jgi:hypothetical protein
VLRFVVIGETAALVVAVVTYTHFPQMRTYVVVTATLLRLLSSADLAKGHATKSAKESKHSNHNIRAHMGKMLVYNNSNN